MLNIKILLQTHRVSYDDLNRSYLEVASFLTGIYVALSIWFYANLWNDLS